MASTQRRLRHRTQLRLVETPAPDDLPPVLTDPAARKEFEQLTQALLDAVIEIMDLADGESDVELNGDEGEDDDGA